MKEELNKTKPIEPQFMTVEDTRKKNFKNNPNYKLHHINSIDFPEYNNIFNISFGK